MKIRATLLTFLVLLLSNVHAQEYTQLGLPEGAVARLGKGSITAIQYSPDGTRLAAANSIRVSLYDTTTYRAIAVLTGHKYEVRSIAFSPDGRTLVSASWDGTVRLWDAVTGEHKRLLTGYASPVLSVAFSPDGTTIASGAGSDALIHLWDAVTGELKGRIHRP